MARRIKSRKKGSFRKPGSKNIWLIGFLILLAGTFGVLLFFQKEPPPTSPSQPAYEEIHSTSLTLQNEINLIDRAIYQVLYKCGISEKDVIFTEVGHRYIEESIWDFVELQIKINDRKILSKLEEEIERSLATQGSKVQWIKDTWSSYETIIDIFIRSHFTHRIRLIIEKPRKPVPKRRMPKVAIIIDDLGYDRRLARAFAELDIPISMSVLPMAPRTKDVAGIAKNHDRELLLHIPMEPKGFPELNPGPGALLLEMDKAEILDLVKKHLNEVPDARGVNNHMGSLFTENSEKMALFLEELKERNLFFIDSRTSGGSVGYRLAREMGVRSARRNVFLDNEPSKNAIDIQMERLLGIARHRGSAIGIAHPFPGTLKALETETERLKKEVELVSAFELTK
jgi:polysaccharide deacetylase 2 family uncharacterized protein YibQ